MGDALSLLGIETGAFGLDDAIAGGASVVNTFADIAAGGPQKRERAAKYGRDAAIAAKDAALAQLEAAKLAASAPMPSGGGAMSIGGGGGILATLQAPSPLGVPWWIVGVGVGIAAWAVLR